MFGAILGDIVGSPYEFDENNIKTKNFPLFTEASHFTDDSVMTLAVAQALFEAGDRDDDETLKECFVRSMRALGRAYPNAGYGVRFSRWLANSVPEPYNSCGNGSAMRVSAVAWMFDSLDEVRRVARLSAEVTHNHPEGIKGAEAVACAIFLARTGHSKEEIRSYTEEKFGYDLSRSCDAIRPGYYHVESCQETVPQAFAAFLEGESFEDVLRLAVSLGGDSDTLAAIVGSMAEAYYGIDENWKKAAISRLSDDLAQILRRFDLTCGYYPAFEPSPIHEAIRFAEKAHRGQKRKGTNVDYITHPMEVFQILTTMNAGQELLIAGLLHDTVEDTDVTIAEIHRTFGERVATLVGTHSEDKSKSWRERKQHTIDMLKQAERDVKLLILADKVSNLRSMLSDYAQVGEELWNRFNAPKELQSWYNSEVQDALYDLQFDDDACFVYWEYTALYKDLFVAYHAGLDHKTLYQSACGVETFSFFPEDGIWEPYHGQIPESAVPVSRIRAERLEDLWCKERCDDTLHGNQQIESAIAAFSDDQTEEHYGRVLQAVLERSQQNGNMVIPVERVGETVDGDKRVEQFGLQTIELHTGESAAAAFTNYAAARKAPETELCPLLIEQFFEVVCRKGDIAGLLINPWGSSFFLSKSALCMLLEKMQSYE